MTRLRFRVLGALGALGLVAAVAGAQPAADDEGDAGNHVLLISVDGLHQTDLAWYVRTHPDSALAELVGRGVEFTNARTPFPSDSFPGMVAQVTGGHPSSTGVYYDDSWNTALLPAGTTKCTGVAPGVEVTYFEQADKNPSALDAGQGLAGLPGSILHMTGNATSLIDPSHLPVDPVTCKPVYPHPTTRRTATSRWSCRAARSKVDRSTAARSKRFRSRRPSSPCLTSPRGRLSASESST